MQEALLNSWLQSLSDLDRVLFQVVNQTWRCAALDALMPWLTWLGSGLVALPLGLVLLGPRLAAVFGRPASIARVPPDPRARGPWLGVLAGVALAIVANGLLKHLIDRPRPPADALLAPPAQVLGEALFAQSMPSGHTLTAFILATLVGLAYPRWAPLALALAVPVGLSRVYLGVHYPLDVLAGAALGAGLPLAGWWFARRWSRAARD